MSRIKTLRDRYGWPQERMAQFLGVDQSTVSRIEHGRREPGPVAKLLDQLEAAIARGERGEGSPVSAAAGEGGER